MATVASLHKPHDYHLFFLVDVYDALGTSDAFCEGLEWDPDGSCGTGSLSDKAIIDLLRQYLNLLRKPSSSIQRRTIFYKLWDGAYNEASILNLVAYYKTNFGLRQDSGAKLTHVQRIQALLLWGIPFVPYPAWNALLHRHKVLRDQGVAYPLNLRPARLRFYVDHSLLSDSLSLTEVAFGHSNASTNPHTAVATGGIYTAAFAKDSPPRTKKPFDASSVSSDTPLKIVQHKLLIDKLQSTRRDEGYESESSEEYSSDDPQKSSPENSSSEDS